ncbi:MAG: hypothetical protein A2284_01540 [Deltaproteobacteria bacterium RIFOXYA12_FULL_61_11]|nr:MAG: hypothetical protein A2284_01540 [Deltaproteobacteria bacterium RIFOXYA12_FULL_61_11]
MAPYLPGLALSPWMLDLIYLLIGFAFGFVLEQAGFGNSKKLAAQFYLTELTVLKVMFGAIVVAMVLIFGSSFLGLLDYDLVWVNPTFLWSGLVGGFVMGLGFIIGGFCPGTSLVALATLKLDGLVFVLGVLVGIGFFAETVAMFEDFWNAGHAGRLTLPELFGLDTGIVVLGVVLMALSMFAAAEFLERTIGGKPAPSGRGRTLLLTGAAVLIVAGAALAVRGEPTREQRWVWKGGGLQHRLSSGEVSVHPAELLLLLYDDQVEVLLLDLREETSFNLFHLPGARRVEDLPLSDEVLRSLKLRPWNAITVLLDGDGGRRVRETWGYAALEAVPNLYFLEGGMDGWLDLFGHPEHGPGCTSGTEDDTGSMGTRHLFSSARGDRVALPPLSSLEGLDFVRKVRFERGLSRRKGGCG